MARRGARRGRDPRAGADALAWWERGPGRLERERALLAMWHEVPWRSPVDDTERALMERVDADLRAACAWRDRPGPAGGDPGRRGLTDRPGTVAGTPDRPTAAGVTTCRP